MPFSDWLLYKFVKDISQMTINRALASNSINNKWKLFESAVNWASLGYTCAKSCKKKIIASQLLQYFFLSFSS